MVNFDTFRGVIGRVIYGKVPIFDKFNVENGLNKAVSPPKKILKIIFRYLSYFYFRKCNKKKGAGRRFGLHGSIFAKNLEFKPFFTYLPPLRGGRGGKIGPYFFLHVFRSHLMRFDH